MTSGQILVAAVAQFGRSGFEGTSTRDIARASDTAMSLITYHFGGKTGLYLAAAEHIAKGIAAAQAPALAIAQAAVHRGRDEAIEALLTLLDSFAQMMLRPESEDWARFIIREQQYPTEAFERIYGGAMRDVTETYIALIARVRDDLDEREARAAAILLFGQALILRAGRASVCRVLGIDRVDDAAAALLRARLRANALCILSEKPR